MRAEQNTKAEDIMPPQIDRLLILDRAVDLVTPMVTQLTYEGLIDEVYGIKNSKIFDTFFYRNTNSCILANCNFPGDKFSNGEQSDEPNEFKKVSLTSKDELFAQLRDKNFNAVGPILKSTAKIITEQYEVVAYNCSTDLN